ncbi:NAD(P)/FAD-dependent oxidoreductase [Glutamicibacter protophormiae]|uniref:Thioredoxin reductase n=1 Tax=Glutamicibacter protophormiae TaxID=37930 RepID=A0ABS4XTD5_GLUPR|nr:NAD(P)/FAD-dependent oxidoreductase [Glutamicibacter protophormiae]MBP2399774.1 thioredoxin reductase [Glutamicibacter protophormiae]GGL89093.1 thioredoxin reductase [Glutamicibacter protophormiae]
MEHYDAIIIGGGSAGLAAAVALGRSRRSVLVIDTNKPRNARASHAHNVLGQEGISPQHLLELGRSEAEHYGARIVTEEAEHLTGSIEDGFTVKTDTSEYSSSRIVLATGLTDDLAGIPGLREAWGVSAIHCAYCHGWEVRDQAVAVLGVGPMSIHQALLFAQLSSRVVFINHQPNVLSEENRATLDKLGVPIVESRIARLRVNGDGQLEGVELSNGDLVDAQAAVVASRMNANAGLYQQLGGQLQEHPLGTFIQVSEMGLTGIPGVYAAGNAANLGAMVMAAAASGTVAGAALNADLAISSLNSELNKMHA